MLRILITRQSRYPADTKAIKSRVRETLVSHNVSDGTVSVTLVGERKMRELGKKFLNETDRDPVHEVLSFPFHETKNEEFVIAGDDGLNLGDIVICYPEARRIAMKRNRMVDDVLCELAEHATLHLLGIHHD
jgi:rRNA maturation RNase YbeY